MIPIQVINNKGTMLMHCTESDSRFVQTTDGNHPIKFDASLGVHSQQEQIGHMAYSSGTPQTWTYKSTKGEQEFDTQVPLNNHHWKNIEDAEVAIARHLLSMQKNAT